MTTESSYRIMKFDRQGGAADINVETLEQAFESGDLCWIHLDYSQTDAREWLQGIDWLDLIIKNNLVDDDTRPRSFTLHKGLFLSLRGVNLNPGADPEDMIAVRMWADERCIITSNRRKLLSLDDVSKALTDGCGPGSAAEFATLLIERLALRAETVIEQIENEFDDLEDELSISEGTGLRISLSGIRRQAIRLRRFLGPQREALEHLLHDSPDWVTKQDKAHIRESLNKFNRFIEELDTVRDRAIVAQEEILGKLSETLNQRMYTLSLVATLFLPLGFLTGLLGINVGGIPGADSPYGFLAICLGISVFVIAMIAYLRSKKWF